MSIGLNHDHTSRNLTALWHSLEQGLTLPAEWYTDPLIFAQEKTQIFRHAWQYVGLLEQVSTPGSFFTCTLAGVPLIITCDEDCNLHALVNVCRHRGAEVVRQECGQRASLQCHYHGWTYNLKGELYAAPGMKYEEGFDKTQFTLQSVQIASWGPFLFATLDKEAAPLTHTLGALPELLLATGVNLNGLKHRVRQTYEVQANWKIVVDNYLECYHCPIAHPSFSALIDTNNYTVTEYEFFSTQGGPQKVNAHPDKAPKFNKSGVVTDGFFAYLWPNFTLNLYPGPGSLSLNLFLPLAVNKTLAIFDYLFADEVSQSDQEHFDQFIDQVQQEDIVLCESVQRGLDSGYFEQGKLMLRHEKALRHFQKLVYQSVHKALL
ncbi:MAG TPA: aromatic ring-hydroxylating dioxygenase subunit alpha [Ktedonobacteraceae bacterium]|nr:aromatic ring-hydroxylating dioxygenase subunit alpha [Ktedonobacteraceae bacterium]